MATPLWQRRVERIVRLTQHLSVDDIRCRAAALRRQCDQPDHDLAWWNETLVVDRELRRARRSRVAAIAAHRAVEALTSAARRGGLGAGDADVLCLADALRSVTRATAIGFVDPFGADVLGIAAVSPVPAPVPAVSVPERSFANASRSPSRARRSA